MDKVWSFVGHFLSFVCLIFICSLFSTVKADINTPAPNSLVNMTNSTEPSEVSAIPLDEKKTVEVNRDENGEIDLDDLPVNSDAVSPSDSNSIVSDIEFDDSAEGEEPLEGSNEEILNEPVDSELQNSTLRQYDIKNDIQDSPLLQYDMKSDLQNSPLKKYEMKFNGKEANTTAEKVEDFKKYPQGGIAPKFKGNTNWKAPYQKQ